VSDKIKKRVLMLVAFCSSVFLDMLFSLAREVDAEVEKSWLRGLNKRQYRGQPQHHLRLPR
jgi:hypothetical protein